MSVALPPTLAASIKYRGRYGMRGEAGAVTVIFATSVVPIIMLASLVIDYGWVLQAKSQLDLAADATAMAAARTAASGYAAGQSQANYLSEANLAASQWWAAQAGAVTLAKTFSETPTIVQTGQNFQATIAYTATINEILPSFFSWINPKTGAGNASIASSATVSITVHGYGTVDFLLDNTSSMMLPATDADLAILQAAEQTWINQPGNSPINADRLIAGGDGLVGWNGASNSYGLTLVNGVPSPALPLTIPTGWYCAFACHWDAASTKTNPTDYYGVARQAGETLRFDVVQSATVTAIQQMEALEQTVGQLSVGVFAFGGVGTSSPNYLTTIVPETPIDATVKGVTVRNAGAVAAIAALSNISPPVTADTPNTNIGLAMADTLAITGSSGTGYTASSPKKSLIMVTDGVEDDTNPQSIPSTEGPINASVCNAMKTAGYTIYILYTPYSSAAPYLPNNMALQPYLTSSSSPSVLASLQSCASSSADLIEATSPTDIQAAMSILINEAVGNTTTVTN